MAVSTDSNILAMLKVYYRDKVENLLFRDSPVLGKFKKVRVGGSSVNFPAVYGHGGAVGGNYLKAKANAAQVARDVQFAVTPGNLFSVYTMNAKEVLASRAPNMAFMNVAGLQMDAATDAFRKTMATALYGTGYGEIAAVTSAYAFVANTPINITLPNSAVMGIDIGTVIDEKSSISSSTVNTMLTVNSIGDDGTINVTPSATFTTSVNDVFCLDGSIGTSGEARLPVGFGGWLPVVAGRTGATWTSYIGTTFFGVNRSLAVSRLAGVFYTAATATEKYSTSIQKLLMKIRRQGGRPDIMVLNDLDWLGMSAEVASTSTFFNQTSTKEKKVGNLGHADITAAFSTNYIENVYDDPFAPQGRFYILSEDALELLSMTNPDKVDSTIVGNEAGKADLPQDDGQANTNYQLLINDYLNVQSSEGTIDGPGTQVTLQFFGTFAVVNPSVCGVGEFGATTSGATDWALSVAY